MKIKKNMKQWELFFKANENASFKTGEKIDNGVISIPLEMLYQNFKERLLDELVKERYLKKQETLDDQDNKDLCQEVKDFYKEKGVFITLKDAFYLCDKKFRWNYSLEQSYEEGKKYLTWVDFSNEINKGN